MASDATKRILKETASLRKEIGNELNYLNEKH